MAISADPAWQFDDRGIRGGTGKHYRTMPVDAICALPVGAVAAEHAHLYLWAPNAFVIDGTAAHVAACWGWRPVQKGTWIKPRIGTGRYFRNTTEDFLFCVRPGSTARDHRRSARLPTHYYWPNAGHSEKPAQFYREVVEVMSRGPYLELFSRYRRPGWTCLGDGIDGKDIGEALVELASKGDHHG